MVHRVLVQERIQWVIPSSFVTSDGLAARCWFTEIASSHKGLAGVYRTVIVRSVVFLCRERIFRVAAPPWTGRGQVITRSF